MTTKLDQRQSRYDGVLCRMFILVLASSLSLSAAIRPCAGQTHKDSNSDPGLFKLQANISALGKTGVQDALWRYYSEQGAKAYANRDYAAAEKFYTASLQDAEKRHIDDRNLALIVTNLATTLRDEGDFEQAAKLFKRSLSLSEKLGSGQQSAYSYTLRQYAALLRKTGREEEARFAYEAARNGQYLLSGAAAPAEQDSARQPDLARNLQAQQPMEAERRRMAGEAQSPPAPDDTISSGPPADGQPEGHAPEQNILIWNVVGVGLSPGQGQPSVQTLDSGSTYFSGPPGPYLKQVLDHLFAPQ
jgi:hypothetical protein